MYTLEHQETSNNKRIIFMYKTWKQYVQSYCDEVQDNQRHQEWRRLMCSVMIHIYLYQFVFMFNFYIVLYGGVIWDTSFYFS
jgi:hypothetical protein